MSDLRTCTWCGREDVVGECPTCAARWENRRDAGEMTVDDRVAEWRSMQPILEIAFARFHERVEELVGRPVWTHELARPELLEHEIATGDRPTFAGVIAKFPADKPVIVVAPDERRKGPHA
jgi:hypothetical protein